MYKELNCTCKIFKIFLFAHVAIPVGVQMRCTRIVHMYMYIQEMSSVYNWLYHGVCITLCITRLLHTCALSGLVNLNLWTTSVRESLTHAIVNLIPRHLWGPRPNGRNVWWPDDDDDTGHLLGCGCWSVNLWESWCVDLAFITGSALCVYVQLYACTCVRLTAHF